MTRHENIKSWVFSELEIKHVIEMLIEGKNSKTKVDSYWTNMGELFSVASLYLIGSISWRVKPSSLAKEVGIISVTDLESGRTEIEPFWVPSWVITPVILGVGSEKASESVATTPWPLEDCKLLTPDVEMPSSFCFWWQFEEEWNNFLQK